MTDAVALTGVSHRYGTTVGLAQVSLSVPEACTLGLIGPDGVGKSTLLALIAGAKAVQDGRVVTLGADMRRSGDRTRVQPRIAYMPQGLGKNLYPDIGVREHLEFFGKLFGLTAAEREERSAALLTGTGLAPFADRPMGKLSGGMKQKLGLCCALIHDPDLLILDEPTTGVDPLSRRQFWELVARIRENRPRMSVLVATSYMDEAEQFDQVAALHGGVLLACAPPADLKARTGGASLEDAFVALLPPEAKVGHRTPAKTALPAAADDAVPAIEARGLTRRFGDFTAVDHVDFSIRRGEIFGFLGSNGCGKSTTMKMLTGLLPSSSGDAFLLGQPVDPTDLDARRKVGYMSQAFSLYGELTVRQNLRLHARIFRLAPEAAAARQAELAARFGLAPYLDHLSGDLPLGVRQRLSLAVAILHEPEILILDEPTSGVDPVARDAFWQELFALSRDQGVTIFVSTHFMNEAARCDRIAFMHAGRVLAIDTPEALQAARGADSLDEAFIGAMEDALGPAAETDAPFPDPRPPQPGPPAFSPNRLGAYAWREALEMLRDRVRLTVALFGTALLMIVFGYGISMDVEKVPFAVLDYDRSPESRAYLEQFQGSSYFREVAAAAGPDGLMQALRGARIAAGIEIPPDFGLHLRRGQPTEVGVIIDGAMPFRAETIEGYVAGLHQQFLATLAQENGVAAAAAPIQIETRFRYNQGFRSLDAMVPATIALLLVMIPAILMALAVVREKEMGTIANFYVTPTSRFEFLIGKQIPYVLVGMVNFVLMALMAVTLFGVPLKGSLAGLALGGFAYVTCTTGIGLFMSSFARTQIAALFGTAIASVMPAVQFSGMMQPVASLEDGARLIGTFFPTTYFMKISVGAFTKGLGFAELLPFLLSLLAFVPVLWGGAMLLLKKQER